MGYNANNSIDNAHSCNLISAKPILNKEDYKIVKSFFISSRETDVFLDSSIGPLQKLSLIYQEKL